MSKTVYAARVKDPTGAKWDGKWHQIKTNANPTGQYKTKKLAQKSLDTALSHDDRLIGHVYEIKIDVKPTLETIRINDWLHGDVTPVAQVPSKYRADYLDTLRRAALAASRTGQRVYVSDSFRSRELQEQRWATYLAGGFLAARPGTSLHERGLALDIPNARDNKKLIKELRKLKMIDDVPVEKWHISNRS